MVQTRSQHQAKEKAAQKIQRAAKAWLNHPLSNADDRDPITLELIADIPRDRLFYMRTASGRRMGFDACAWLPWLLHDGRHPSTRERVPRSTVRACLRTANAYLKKNPAESTVQLRAAIEKYTQDLKIQYITLVSLHPVRWFMLLVVSPLKRLQSLHVEISSGVHPQATVSYEVTDARDDEPPVDETVRLDNAIYSSSSSDNMSDHRVLAVGSDARAAAVAEAFLSGGSAGGGADDEEDEDDEDDDDDSEFTA